MAGKDEVVVAKGVATHNDAVEVVELDGYEARKVVEGESRAGVVGEDGLKEKEKWKEKGKWKKLVVRKERSGVAAKSSSLESLPEKDGRRKLVSNGPREASKYYGFQSTLLDGELLIVWVQEASAPTITLPGYLSPIHKGDASFVPLEMGMALLSEEDGKKMEEASASRLLNGFVQRAMANFIIASSVADKYKDLARALEESNLDRDISDKAVAVALTKLGEEEKVSSGLKEKLEKEKEEVAHLRVEVEEG